MSGKDLRQQVDEALAKMAGLGIEDLAATIDGDVVTLTGTARDVATKGKAMTAFNTFIVSGNVLNMIRVDHDRASSLTATIGPPSPPRPGAAAHQTPPSAVTQRIHVVEKGETLSRIAQKYYGKAGGYKRIFDANRDVLSDPDEIRPGQRLRIP
jgi:LysM repeat protein